MKTFRNLIILIFFLIINSCEKDKDLTKSEMLTQKAWLMKSGSVNPPINNGNAIISDIFNSLPDCSQDDLLIFKSNGSYTQEEGKTKCEPTDLTVYDMGSWSFNYDETLLTIVSTYYGYIRECQILKLSSTELSIQYQLYDTLGTAYTFIEAYRH
jgi:hypothetical protein